MSFGAPGAFGGTSIQAAPGLDAFSEFYTARIPELVKILVRIQEEALIFGQRHIRNLAEDIIVMTLTDLNRLAERFAETSAAAIIAEIHKTASRNRPQTGNMEAHIVSKPGPLGQVKVAMLQELEKIVNPQGYGSFWRAQEYGTGNQFVPGQAGRVIHGSFQPGGGAPDPEQRGLGVGTDQRFVPGGGGFGTITVELPGRHFLTNGTAASGAAYLEAMDELQTRIVARLATLRDEIKGIQTQRSATFILKS